MTPAGNIGWSQYTGAELAAAIAKMKAFIASGPPAVQPKLDA